MDIDKVAPQVAMGAWWNTGQSCIAIKRVYIHESIYERFLRALVDFTRSQVTVGGPSSNGVSVVGPIQNEMQYRKLKDLIEKCRKEGHKFALDQPDTAQEELARQSLESGFFLWPMIVDNPPKDSSLVTDEQFGRFHMGCIGEHLR